MKSKEEILKKHILLGQSELDITKDNEFEGEDYKITEKYLCNAMEEYAMQFKEDMANDINRKLDLLIGLCEKRISDCVVNKLNILEVDTQGMLFAYKTFKQYINKQD